MRRVSVVMLLVVAASCSGSPAPVRTQTVAGTEMAFTPSVVSVTPGRYRFHFVNRGTVTHELALLRDGDVLTRSQAQPGASADLDVVSLAAGTYQMKCQELGHEQAGMVGTVAVK